MPFIIVVVAGARVYQLYNILNIFVYQCGINMLNVVSSVFAIVQLMHLNITCVCC